MYYYYYLLSSFFLKHHCSHVFVYRFPCIKTFSTALFIDKTIGHFQQFFAVQKIMQAHECVETMRVLFAQCLYARKRLSFVRGQGQQCKGVQIKCVIFGSKKRQMLRTKRYLDTQFEHSAAWLLTTSQMRQKQVASACPAFTECNAHYVHVWSCTALPFGSCKVSVVSLCSSVCCGSHSSLAAAYQFTPYFLAPNTTPCVLFIPT